MTDTEVRIHRIYAAFNARDVEGVLTELTDDVEWPRAFKGGYVQGHAAVGEYWRHQWAEISPRVDPVEVSEPGDGRVVVKVHQVVHSLAGELLGDEEVVHTYTRRGDLFERMDLG